MADFGTFLLGAGVQQVLKRPLVIAALPEVDFGTFVLRQGVQKVLKRPLVIAPLPINNFGTFSFPKSAGGPGPSGDVRKPGDYPGRAFHGPVPQARSVVYTAKPNVSIVITEIGFLNVGGVAATVDLWIGGTQRISAQAVASGKSIGDKMLWQVRPGETLELKASTGEVVVFIEGVEVVS